MAARPRHWLGGGFGEGNETSPSPDRGGPFKGGQDWTDGVQTNGNCAYAGGHAWAIDPNGDTFFCPVPPVPAITCGVNPITNSPGIITKPSGRAGQLRPGLGGGGDEDSRRRNGPHLALDIAGNSGTDAVHSMLDGTVSRVGVDPNGFGNFVVVDVGHGYSVVYGHFQDNSITVKSGDQVKQGQDLGIVGQTGNAAGQPLSEAHVHIEIWNGPVFNRQLGRKVSPHQFLDSECPW